MTYYYPAIIRKKEEGGKGENGTLKNTKKDFEKYKKMDFEKYSCKVLMMLRSPERGQSEPVSTC